MADGRNAKRQRMDDSIEDQQIDLSGEPSKVLKGSVPVTAYVKSYLAKVKVSGKEEVPVKKLEEKVSVKKLECLLKGMTLTKSEGGRKTKFTFHGVSYEDINKLEGLTANRNRLINVPIKECSIFMEDNQGNARLRRLVDNLQEYDYLKEEDLKGKWQLAFVAQNHPPNETQKALLWDFYKSMADICGKGANDSKITLIGSEEDLRDKLKKATDKRILLCVMEKNQAKRFYRAVKQDAELEKGILTKFCNIKNVSKEKAIVTSLALEMAGKLGLYKADALFRDHAFPNRFGDNCKVMYLGYNVINSDPQIAVMVGNIGPSDLSTSEYESSVARGEYMEYFPAIFHKLLQRKIDLPDKIIFFREGFVRGQIERTLQQEFDALRQIVDGLRRDKNEAKYVPITFIVGRKIIGTRSVSVRDGKGSYTVFADENALCYYEFESLIRKLSYSRRYPKPLPAHYAKRAAKLAQIYLEGKENTNHIMTKIAETIDKSLYVIGGVKRQSTEKQNQPAEKQQNQSHNNPRFV